MTSKTWSCPISLPMSVCLSAQQSGHKSANRLSITPSPTVLGDTRITQDSGLLGLTLTTKRLHLSWNRRGGSELMAFPGCTSVFAMAVTKLFLLAMPSLSVKTKTRLFLLCFLKIDLLEYGFHKGHCEICIHRHDRVNKCYF